MPDYTKDQIRQLEGRELDAAYYRIVLKTSVFCSDIDGEWFEVPQKPMLGARRMKRVNEDLNLAIELMSEGGPLEYFTLCCIKSKWYVSDGRHEPTQPLMPLIDLRLPVAICRAACIVKLREVKR